MTQTEALRMALEALEGNCTNPVADPEQAAKEDIAIAAIKEALAQQSNEQVEPEFKLMPREATREMLKAMDECSMEGYDERLYAGHAGSVYMAAWDAFAHPFVPTAQPKPLDDAVLYLSSLVYALDNAFISSWQSTASWQIQLDEAKEYLTAHGIKE